jgi:hypothetical protein
MMEKETCRVQRDKTHPLDNERVLLEEFGENIGIEKDRSLWH